MLPFSLVSSIPFGAKRPRRDPRGYDGAAAPGGCPGPASWASSTRRSQGRCLHCESITLRESESTTARLRDSRPGTRDGAVDPRSSAPAGAALGLHALSLALRALQPARQPGPADPASQILSLHVPDPRHRGSLASRVPSHTRRALHPVQPLHPRSPALHIPSVPGSPPFWVP